ncbi:MAG: hypothetical protein R2824_15530 [Saprospiraceae bacterium]|nr:hypothetical protein [Lewinella sp.]
MILLDTVNDPLDHVISALIVLLVLSIISEKLTDLIRSYPRQSRALLYCLLVYLIYALLPSGKPVSYIGNLFLFICILVLVLTLLPVLRQGKLLSTIDERVTNARKTILPNIEKTPFSFIDPRTERQVLVLNYIIGFVVAFLFKADIFAIFKSQNGSPQNSLGWSAERFAFKNDLKLNINWALENDDIVILLGILITGFFLSFGSKFFHDLLDYLLTSKNLRRKLFSKELYQLQSIEEIRSFLTDAHTQHVFIENTVEKYKNTIFRRKNIHNVALSHHLINGKQHPVVEVHLFDSDTSGLPQALPMEAPFSYAIPIRYITNVAIPKVHIGMGAEILSINQTSANQSSGTFGCVVRSKLTNKKFGITCCHVVNFGLSTRRRIDPDNVPIVKIKDRELQPVIEELLHWNIRSPKFDIALIGPLTGTYENIRDDQQTALTHILGKSRTISPVDFEQQTQVGFYGVSSGFQEGRIASKSLGMAKIAYHDQEVTMQDIIMIGKKQEDDSWRSISQKGDSGAIVFDLKTLEVLGLLIAGNSEYSYVIPLQPFLSLKDYEIDT